MKKRRFGFFKEPCQLLLWTIKIILIRVAETFIVEENLENRRRCKYSEFVEFHEAEVETTS